MEKNTNYNSNCYLPDREDEGRVRHLIILGDGMADWHVAELGDKTLLQYADTPAMDWLAAHGRTGMLRTVPDGFHPGSEVANSSILGYDQHLVYEGRGPLEAAAIGVDLQPDDLALRCNFVCIEGATLKNHSCGRLDTEEAAPLIDFLNERLASDPRYEGRVRFYTGVQYRHLLVVRGGNKHIHCTPPHDIPCNLGAIIKSPPKKLSPLPQPLSPPPPLPPPHIQPWVQCPAVRPPEQPSPLPPLPRQPSPLSPPRPPPHFCAISSSALKSSCRSII